MIRLRELREQRFLSQRQLARAAGVAEATVVRIEQGQTVPNFTTVRKLAEGLGVEPGELVPDPMALAAAQRRVRKGKE